MRYLSILTLAVLFISCEDSETVYEYPDGIAKPTNLVESGGCGNIFVYQYLDSLKALTVWMNAKEFQLTKKRQDVNVDTSNSNLSVVLEIAGNSPDSIYFNFCNDVAYPNRGVTTKYRATSGKLSFSVSEDNPIKEPARQSFYYVTIRVTDLHLVNKTNNNEIIVNEVVFWNVGVGLLPG